jgi:hypothetical protein
MIHVLLAPDHSVRKKMRNAYDVRRLRAVLDCEHRVAVRYRPALSIIDRLATNFFSFARAHRPSVAIAGDAGRDDRRVPSSFRRILSRSYFGA